VLDCINLTSFESVWVETIIDYSQLRLHSSTSLAVLMSSGAPPPQFYCGLSFVQQLLRSYRGLRFSSLLSPLCFPPDSIRANLDTLFTSSYCQSHSHLSSLSQIWSIMILMIDSRRPVGSFGWTRVHCLNASILQFMTSPYPWCVATRLLGGEILLSFYSWFRVRLVIMNLACPWCRYLGAVDPLLAQIWNRLGEVDLHRQKIGKLFLLPFSRCLLAQCFLVMSWYSNLKRIVM